MQWGGGPTTQVKIFPQGYILKPYFKKKKIEASLAVELCPHCTGKLLILSRGEKAEYSPDPP